VKDTDTFEVVVKNLLRKAGLESAAGKAGSDVLHGRSQL
jgi:hypothetical protein